MPGNEPEKELSHSEKKQLCPECGKEVGEQESGRCPSCNFPLAAYLDRLRISRAESKEREREEAEKKSKEKEAKKGKSKSALENLANL